MHTSRALVASVLVALGGCGSRTSATPSEADYAARLMRLLQRERPDLKLRYDPEKHAIVDGADFLLSLINVYQEYLSQAPGDRDAALARVAKSIQGPGDLTTEQARRQLRPVVRASMYFDVAMQSGGEVKTHVPSVLIGDATARGVAIDTPTMIALVTDENLAEWKLSFEDAQTLALANLRAMNVPFEQVSPGVWSSSVGDSYDSSRLLLVDEIRKLGLAPPVVALIPNRDLLLLASGTSEPALLMMAEMATQFADSPRPNHTIPLCLDGASWSECIPDVTPAVRSKYHRLAILGWDALYADQHDSLQAAVGDQVFVASYMAAENKARDVTMSVTAWTHGVSTLLPRVEVLTFVDVDANGTSRSLGTASWDRVMAVAGDRVKREDRSPPRWATGTYFPSAEELAQLKLTPDPFAAHAP